MSHLSSQEFLDLVKKAGFKDEDAKVLCSLVMEASDRYGADPAIIASIINSELKEDASHPREVQGNEH